MSTSSTKAHKKKKIKVSHDSNDAHKSKKPAVSSSSSSSSSSSASNSTDEQHKLVKDGGVQAFPPYVLPPPAELKAEMKAWRANAALRLAGLGLFAAFHDVDLLRFFRHLDADSLVNLGMTSKWMYVFCEDDERWKRITIRRHKGEFRFKGTWKRTCLMARDKDHTLRALPDIRAVGFYSPYLYELHYRANVSMDYFRSIPKESVDRRLHLTVDEFTREYLIPNKPVVVAGALEHWRAATEWTLDKLCAKYGDVRFKTDEVDHESHKFKMAFADYVQYMRLQRDEDPIYMFDPCFDERAPDMLLDYDIPRFFPEDLFSVLGNDRPDYMWLVIGPERSGSPFHIDPYKTSAWNAVLQGRKRWLLYPPDVDPPGVPVEEDSDDGIDYDAPEPIKYLLEEYPKALLTKPPMEIIMGPGELIYVPSGWWHMVLNIDDCVAVTQNFCGAPNFNWVYNDMKLPSNKKIFKKFRTKLAPVRPDLARQYGFEHFHFQRGGPPRPPSASSSSSE